MDMPLQITLPLKNEAKGLEPSWFSPFVFDMLCSDL